VPTEYIPVFIYTLLAAAFLVGLLFLAKLLRPSAPGKVKQEIYECGIPVSGGTRGRYSVRFYLVAILFVVFDVETIFLFPWAVRYKQLGWFGVAEVTVFLAILFVGYIWAFKKGALRWNETR
jgi:NADH-quinone oxidoreductase subunit A